MQVKCAVCSFVDNSGFKVTQNMGESCLAFSLTFSNHTVSIYFLLIELLLHIIPNLFTTMSFVLSQGIDLENIVYYKDDTHYFVMTAKKQSLLDKGVIRHVGINFLCILCKLKLW